MRSPVNLTILRGVQPREPFDPFPHSSMIRICALASILLLTTPAIAQQAPGGGPPAGGPAAAPAPAPTPTIPAAGDPVKGREKTQLCEGCHGIVGWRTAYPEVYRVPVLLRDIHGLSTEEASAVLRVKPQTLKSRLHRGRLILRKHLGDFAGGLELHSREAVN